MTVQRVLFVLILLSAGVFIEAGEAGRQLSQAETDRAIDEIFQRAANVERMEAELVTAKTGGMVRGQQISHEFLRLEAPSRMVLINRGESQNPLPIEKCNLILVDGRNIWEVEASSGKERSVSRREFRPNVEGLRGKGLGAFIGLFLLGREVSSAAELRSDFNISCVEEVLPNNKDKTLHVSMTPRKGGETVELWLMPGQALPWKVRSFERKEIKFPPPKPGQPPRYKLEETVRALKNVRTNLTGLPPFTADTFTLPLAQDMRIRDETTNQPISPDAVRQELSRVREEYSQSRRQ